VILTGKLLRAVGFSFFCVVVAVGQARAAASASGPPGRITWVGTDNNIYFCSGECAKSECITCPVPRLQVRAEPAFSHAVYVKAQPKNAEYNWPTYSPDGNKLAYISASRSENGYSFGVEIYDFARHDSFEVFASNRERPIYIFWLPDNESLCYLLSESNGLTLMMGKAKELAPARIVANGMPLYFDWNQPLHQFAIHTTGTGSERTEQVTLLGLSDNDQQVKKVLAMGPTPFKAPAWSPDRSHLAYVSAQNDRPDMFLADADGKSPKLLLKLPGGEVCFVWAPDSKRIGYSTTPMPGSMMYEGINLVDIASGKTTRLTKDPVAAFYFSPDASRIVYISEPEGRPYYEWKMVEIGHPHPKVLFNFITTRDEQLSYRYFDQLALSHAIWAPDSSAFVFAGVVVKGELPHGPGLSPPPYVFEVPVETGKPRPIAEGTIAFWSQSPVKQ